MSVEFVLFNYLMLPHLCYLHYNNPSHVEIKHFCLCYLYCQQNKRINFYKYHSLSPPFFKPHATLFLRQYPFLYVFFGRCRPSTHLYRVVALCETMNLERKYSYPHPLFHPPQCFSPKTNGKHAAPQNQVLRLRSAELKPLDESGQRRICNCLYHEKGATR